MGRGCLWGFSPRRSGRSAGTRGQPWVSAGTLRRVMKQSPAPYRWAAADLLVWRTDTVRATAPFKSAGSPDHFRRCGSSKRGGAQTSHLSFASGDRHSCSEARARAVVGKTHLQHHYRARGLRVPSVPAILTVRIAATNFSLGVAGNLIYLWWKLTGLISTSRNPLLRRQA